MATEASDVQEVKHDCETNADDPQGSLTGTKDQSDHNETQDSENKQDNHIKCETCDGSYDSSVDHIEDLCNQVVTKGGEVVKKVIAHWPHFISSQIMQIYCSICSVHLKTFRDLLIHCHLMKTEEGFSTNNKSVEKWTEEIGTNHAEYYTSLVAIIKEISNGIDNYHISLLKPYLCKFSPRYFEIAYISGSYDDTKSPVTENMDLIYSDRLAKVLEESQEDYALVSDEHVDRWKEIEQIFFPNNDVGDITNGKHEMKKLPFNVLKCLKCNELFPNLKRHVVSAMWQLKKPCIDRVRHWTFFFGHNSSKIETFAEEGNTLMCPVCHTHIFRKGVLGFVALFEHLLDNTIPRKYVPNKLSRDHKELLVFITNITLNMVSGDIDSNEVIDNIHSKFTCPEGASYMLSRPRENFKQAQKRPADQRNQRNQNAPKKQRVDQPQKRGGKKVREFYSRKSQQQQRPQDSMPKKQQNSPNVRGSGSNKRMQHVACDLCEYKCNSLDHLREHLRQCLFAGNQMAMEAHLTCFSKMMVFNNNCACPACGCYQMNLLNCFQHIAVMANNREKSHYGAVNMILDQYMKCMTRVVSLQSVTSWLQNVAAMRW